MDKIGAWRKAEEKAGRHHEGWFVINMAGTGCGKTMGNAKIMQALSDDGKSLPVPVVVRLEGTNVEQGRKILQDSPIANVIMAPTMEGGAEEIVKRVKAAE